MKTSIRLIIVAFLLLTFSNSCGSDGGIGGTGISVGTITGFGSVFVNGVEFNTDGALITVDGEVVSESDLGIGMVVTVEGTFDKNGLTGKADRITYEEVIEGPVDEIDLEEETLVVLGRIIQVMDQTVFEGVRLETLMVGDVVEVSALPISGDEIEATRIELKLGPEIKGFEITGVVEDLNEASLTFTIDGVVIDYSNADLDDLPNGTLENGMRVEVESIVGLEDEVLIASAIEPQESILKDAKGLLVEMEGVVTAFTSIGDFEVNGIPVNAEGEVFYQFGLATDISLGVKLEVEGRLDDNGVLFAAEIEFRVENAVEIEANVEDVDAENKRLVLLGIPVTVTSHTQILDARIGATTDSGYGFQDIQVGHKLEVSGILVDGEFIATSAWRIDADSEVSLLGTAEIVADPTMQILGITVVTTDETEFLDLAEMPISSDDFFSEALGSIVEIHGTLTEGNVIIADEVQFEG